MSEHYSRNIVCLVGRCVRSPISETGPHQPVRVWDSAGIQRRTQLPHNSSCFQLWILAVRVQLQQLLRASWLELQIRTLLLLTAPYAIFKIPDSTDRFKQTLYLV
ncbi:unnamed protein product [Acanthoscelides obtectus]|uniref:Uncharacterized protein n=1 Tax=Acanthoscelides obtectus TaxID=200917 RepID=A0A9P0L253_ACAOB|nr:unnamed protein product [Acanthoscelides obtectus]CAK1652882.1 hypothetical protein AOBTE_LOCUS17953 [Acanthoscelides obtectus]